MGPVRLPVFPKSIYYVHDRAGLYGIYPKQVIQEKHDKTGKIKHLFYQ